MSLQDALSQAPKLLCGIPPVNRMYLAKVLSEAVLQYHSTPWLGQEWRSADIMFFGIRDLNTDPLEAPYLRACLIRPEVFDISQEFRRNDPLACAYTTSYHDYSALAPNTLLYSLGIMLIELAFERPLHDMQEPYDVRPSDSPSLSFHRTALRLADVVGRKVNIKYQNVVQRCLRCNFDQNVLRHKLEDLEVRKAYFQTVVCELERCYEAAAIC